MPMMRYSDGGMNGYLELQKAGANAAELRAYVDAYWRESARRDAERDEARSTSADAHALEWLHAFMQDHGDMAPLGRRWLISALGHLSDKLDAYLRSGGK